MDHEKIIRERKIIILEAARQILLYLETLTQLELEVTLEIAITTTI